MTASVMTGLIGHVLHPSRQFGDVRISDDWAHSGGCSLTIARDCCGLCTIAAIARGMTGLAVAVPTEWSPSSTLTKSEASQTKHTAKHTYQQIFGKYAWRVPPSGSVMRGGGQPSLIAVMTGSVLTNLNLVIKSVSTNASWQDLRSSTRS
jgi:hypothetical protein